MNIKSAIFIRMTRRTQHIRIFIPERALEFVRPKAKIVCRTLLSRCCVLAAASQPNWLGGEGPLQIALAWG